MSIVRTLDLDALVLQRGNHRAPTKGPDLKGGGCMLEWASYMAGEPWSDHPKCVSKVLGAFCRRWQDDLDDVGRQMLKPYLPRLIGTAAPAKIENRRAWMVTDWMVREYMPAWLDFAGLGEQATAVRGLAPIIDTRSARAGQPTLEAARQKSAAARAAAWAAGAEAGAAAWDAAWAGAWDAAWAAGAEAGAGAAARAAARAGAAAWDAAWAGAWDAAWAAGAEAGAGAAARAAARAAAWAAGAEAAARAAATKNLEPTKLSLQRSALALLDRLIACGEEE